MNRKIIFCKFSRARTQHCLKAVARKILMIYLIFNIHRIHSSKLLHSNWKVLNNKKKYLEEGSGGDRLITLPI